MVMSILTFENRSDAGPEGETGEEATMRYAKAMRYFVETEGGSFVFAGCIDSQVIGEGGEGFQFVSIMRYPSPSGVPHLGRRVRRLITVRMERVDG